MSTFQSYEEFCTERYGEISPEIKSFTTSLDYPSSEEVIMEPALSHVVEEPECPGLDLINEFTKDDWMQVSGIGDKLAERIVESGPYEDLNDVKKVKGISERIYDNIQTWLKD